MASAYICVDCMMRLSVLGSDKGHFGPCNFCADNDSKPCSLIESSELPIVDMFEKIKTDLNERMSHYTDSRQPTADEVRIAWLVAEIETLHQGIDDLKQMCTDMLSPFFPYIKR